MILIVIFNLLIVDHFLFGIEIHEDYKRYEHNS